MKTQKILTVADNSGTRRCGPVLRIWRNDVTGMEVGSVVLVRFTDEFRQKTAPRQYVVTEVGFDDAFARRIGRHTVTLRKSGGPTP